MPGCPINSVYRSLTGLRGGNGPNWEVMQRLFRNVITKPGNTAKTPRRRDLGRMVIQRARADMRMLLAGKKKNNWDAVDDIGGLTLSFKQMLTKTGRITPRAEETSV